MTISTIRKRFRLLKTSRWRPYHVHLTLSERWISPNRSACHPLNKSNLHRLSFAKLAIVLDSSFSSSPKSRRAKFLRTPTYLEKTLHRLCSYVDASEPHNFLVPYVEHIIRDTLALNQDAHHCTDTMCKAKARTWHDISLRADSLQEI